MEAAFRAMEGRPAGARLAAHVGALPAIGDRSRVARRQAAVEVGAAGRVGVVGGAQRRVVVERADFGLDAVEQDQAKVQQILANLLSNAVKFTPQGGRVDVFSRLEVVEGEPVSEFLMEIVDTGVGIAEDERQMIFEKFRQGHVFQRDDAMSREFTGTGLGLSIVRELCRLLGGDVSVESQLGRGSRFRVRLPLRLAVPDEAGGVAEVAVAAARDAG